MLSLNVALSIAIYIYIDFYEGLSKLSSSSCNVYPCSNRFGAPSKTKNNLKWIRKLFFNISKITQIDYWGWTGPDLLRYSSMYENLMLTEKEQYFSSLSAFWKSRSFQKIPIYRATWIRQMVPNHALFVETTRLDFIIGQWLAKDAKAFSGVQYKRNLFTRASSTADAQCQTSRTETVAKNVDLIGASREEWQKTVSAQKPVIFYGLLETWLQQNCHVSYPLRSSRRRGGTENHAPGTWNDTKLHEVPIGQVRYQARR